MEYFRELPLQLVHQDTHPAVVAMSRKTTYKYEHAHPRSGMPLSPHPQDFNTCSPNTSIESTINMRAFSILSTTLLLLGTSLADHDPTTVNPPLPNEDRWNELDNAPISSLYQCYTGAPNWATTGASVRRAADTLNTTHTGNCFPRKAPGCHLLAVDEYARISFCQLGNGNNGNGGEGTSGNPHEIRDWCSTLRELSHVFVSRCFYRGKAGGFVKINEGRFKDDVVSRSIEFYM